MTIRNINRPLIASCLMASMATPVSAFDAEFELSSLLTANGGDGSRGVVMHGNNPSWFGYSASSVGDINGDGIDDLIIGDREYVAQGGAYILFGSKNGLSAEMQLPNLEPGNGGDGSKGFVIKGVDPNGLTGHRVSGAGDINGDGIDDLLIGDWAASPTQNRDQAGEAYVVFGKNTSVTGNFPALVDLSTLASGDGSTGFVMQGWATNAGAGRTVAGIGDINGDGLDDVAVGSTDYAPSWPGQVYIVFGKDTSVSGNFSPVIDLYSLTPPGGGDGSTGFIINNEVSGGTGNFDISAAGDVNGDGVNDIIIGSWRADGIEANSGKAFVVFGKNTPVAGNFSPTFNLFNLHPGNGGDGSTGFILLGLRTDDFAGRSVSGAGDLNGDGIDDMLIGADNVQVGATASAGKAYVVYGRNTSVDGNFPATVLLGTQTIGGKSAGFVFSGSNTNDHVGSSVSDAGDINNDGIDDIVVGGVSKAYVIFGRKTAFPTTLFNFTLPASGGGDGSTGFVINPFFAGDGTGLFSMGNAGDMNDDGVTDLFVGSFYAPHELSLIYGEGAKTVTKDHNGDGKSDVMLRHSDGRWFYFPLNGRNVIVAQQGGAGITTNNSWQYQGSGDYNGDGKADILVRHSDGRWFYFPMNGRGVITAQQGIAGITTNNSWQYQGSGDMNGDGKDDVLVRHTDGRWFYFPMNGRSVITAQQGIAGITTNTAWQFAGIGDMNGDGKDDVMVRHTDGRWFYFPMNGRSVIVAQQGVAGITTNTSWQFAGAGDMNGDGKDDVLVRHSDGRWFYFPMNGRSVITAQQGVAGITTNTAWQFASMGDMNGDGKDDVLVRHSDGRWFYFPMNGRSVIVAQQGVAGITTNTAWGLP